MWTSTGDGIKDNEGGEMFVFVHGLGCDWSDFRELVSQLDFKQQRT